MSVTLKSELEAKIQERIASGRYSDASEVIAEALQRLEEHERLEHLRALLEVGRQDAIRGDLIDFTPEWIEDLHRRVEERFQRGEEPNPDVCP
jgi:antitoxin ParD1/3/4